MSSSTFSTSTGAAATVSSAGPLTTTFTPAASCTNDFYTNTVSNWYSIGGESPDQCFPSGWASTSQYFSPGVCPDGYTQACSNWSASGTNTETRATCCPTGFFCYTLTAFNFPGQACASIFANEITTIVTDPTALTTMVATLHTKTEAVNGYGISIRYNAKDFVSSTSTSTPSSSTSSSTSNSPSSSFSSTASSQTEAATSSLSVPASPSSSSSSGLSTGAKAGVGVGVSAAVLIALLALVLFILKKRKAMSATYSRHEMDGTGKPEWMRNATTGHEHEIYTPPAEMGRNPPRPIELDGNPNPR
ncbi:hypothetical protein EG329_001947 [Mollisiaceae sp. DMI_Dod_QoI]|nr:hypothetical protein EG329_001947 [Helotiales sp. DMI_Dod_QoI]